MKDTVQKIKNEYIEPLFTKEKLEKALFSAFFCVNFFSVLIMILLSVYELSQVYDIFIVLIAVFLITTAVFFIKGKNKSDRLIVFMIFEVIVVLDFVCQIQSAHVLSMAILFISSLIIINKKPDILLIPLICTGACIDPDFIWFLLPGFFVLSFKDRAKTGKSSLFIRSLAAFLCVVIRYLRFGFTNLFGEMIWNVEENSIRLALFAFLLVCCSYGYYREYKATNDAVYLKNEIISATVLFTMIIIKNPLTIVFLFWYFLWFMDNTPKWFDNLQNVFKAYSDGIIILFTVVICVFRIPLFAVEGDGYSYIPYYLTYTHFGFIKRAFIGEFFFHIFGYHIRYDDMVFFANIFCTIVGMILLFFIYRIYAKIEHKNIITICMLCIFFMSCFMPYYMDLKGRYELSAFTLGVISIYLIILNTNAVFLIPFLMMITVLIHISSLFCVVPLVLLALFYRTFLKPDERCYMNLIVSGMVIVLSAGIFIYLSFFSYRNTVVTPEEGLRIMVDRAGGYEYCTQLDFLEEVIFASPSVHVNNDLAQGIDFNTHFFNFARMEVYIPLMILIFVQFFRHSKEFSGFRRWLCCMLPLLVLCTVPLYMFEADFGRWDLQIVAFFAVSELFLQAMAKRKVVISGNGLADDGVIAMILVFLAATGGSFGVFS